MSGEEVLPIYEARQRVFEAMALIELQAEVPIDCPTTVTLRLLQEAAQTARNYDPLQTEMPNEPARKRTSKKRKRSA